MNLSCAEFKDELSPFVDGELDQQKEKLFAEHVVDCVLCKQEYDQCKELGGFILRSNTEAQGETPDIWAALSTKLPSVCEIIQDDFSAYLDGELLAPAKEGVSLHLEECSDCHARFQDLSKLTRLLSTELQIPDSVDVDIWSGIQSRLNEDCLVIRNELSAFIDKEVATLRHRAITSHIAECPDCKDEFTRLSSTGDLLRNAYQPEIAEDFDLWPAIQAKINVLPLERKEKTASVRVFPMRRLAAVAAAVVAGVAATMIFFGGSFTSESVEPITAEAYLIDQSLGEPTDVAEAVVYDSATP